MTINLDTESLRHELARLRAAEQTAAIIQHQARVEIRLALDYLCNAEASNSRREMIEGIRRAVRVLEVAESELVPTTVIRRDDEDSVLDFGEALEAGMPPIGSDDDDAA